MIPKIGAVLLVSLLVSAGVAAAQATGMPTYNAPYRAFVRHEFGGTVSFPEEGDEDRLYGVLCISVTVQDSEAHLVNHGAMAFDKRVEVALVCSALKLDHATAVAQLIRSRHHDPP